MITKQNKITDIVEKFGYNIQTPNIDVMSMLNSHDLSTIQKQIVANRLTLEELEEQETDLVSYTNNYLHIDKNISRLKDIKKASKLLVSHIDKNSHICIVSDYDCDGVTSGAVLYLSLILIFKYPKENVTVLINKRKNGNGFNQVLMDRIKKVDKHKKIDLIITSDHGSANNAEFGELKSYGMDLLVTDHHNVPVDNYPINADVFINNQRLDTNYYKSVSGCFIAFITMIESYKYKYETKNLYPFNKLTPLVALSTISDVMSLKLPLNRHIVKSGLIEMNSFRNKVWLAIKKILGITGKITYKDLGYKIAPLINTANRVDCEHLAYELLVTSNFTDAYEKATELTALNNMRKKIQTAVLKDTMANKLDTKTYKHSMVFVIDSSLAINGIVAGNIGEQHNLPTICFLEDGSSDTLYKGSGRGIVKGFNLYNALIEIDKENPELMAKFGGHDGAAGVAIEKHKLELFKEAFDKKSKELLQKVNRSSTIKVDAIIPDYMLNPYLLKPLEAMGPYGNDWVEPIFLTVLRIARFFPINNTMAKITFVTKNGREIQATHFFKVKNNFTPQTIREYFDFNKDVYVCYKIGTDNKSGLSMDMEIVSMDQEK